MLVGIMLVGIMESGSWWLIVWGAGNTSLVDTYAVGFARPDRWSRGRPTEHACPWHAVEAHRPPGELDGEVELAVCGAIVQVWGAQKWERVGVGRTACPECARITAVAGKLTRAG
jgi:hypothetical protein